MSNKIRTNKLTPLAENDLENGKIQSPCCKAS